MSIVLYVVSVLFGGLSIVVAGMQIKKEGPSVPALFMSGGACVLTIGVLCSALKQPFDWPVALLGCGMICAAAMMNGKKSGNFHLLHHVVRISLSVLLVAGFVFW